jgi:hypothetical protein
MALTRVDLPTLVTVVRETCSYPGALCSEWKMWNRMEQNITEESRTEWNRI